MVIGKREFWAFELVAFGVAIALGSGFQALAVGARSGVVYTRTVNGVSTQYIDHAFYWSNAFMVAGVLFFLIHVFGLAYLLVRKDDK